MNRDFAISALHGLFSSRYPTLMSGIRYDVLEAAMLTEHGWQVTAPQQVRFRARVMERLAEEVPFVQTATRPINLVSAARKKGIEYGTEDPLSRLEHAALESAEGLELFELASEQDALLLQASETEQDEDVIRLLMALQDPINRFFDNTMVMVDEPEVRYARLTLLQAVSQQLLVAGDFSKIVIEG